MKIAFCGTGGVGKTTLVKKLQDYFSDREFTRLDEITRTLKNDGFPINNSESNNYDITQLMVLGSHLHNLTHTKFIADRCLIDGYAYTEYLALQNKVNNPVRDAVANSLEAGLKMYDIIFYIPIEFGVEDDGVRSTDDSFRRGVDKIMRDYIAEVRVNRGVNFIHEISGSIEERFQMIKQIILNHQ